MTAIVMDETNTPQEAIVRKSLEPKKAQRAVSFSPNVSVVETIHLSNYTVAEMKATWLDVVDIHEIKKENRYTISLMQQNLPIDETVYCTRGLEKKTKSAAGARRQTKFLAIDSVIAEQEVQEDQGVTSCDLLAAVYSEYCYKNQMDAYMVGIEDAACAQKLAEQSAVVEPKVVHERSRHEKRSVSPSTTPKRQQKLRLLPRRFFSGSK